MRTLFYCFFFLPCALVAQTLIDVNGRVFDAENKPIPQGDVLLYKEQTLIHISSLTEGQFSIMGIPSGNYRLKISCLGFRLYEQILNLTSSQNLDLSLEEDIEQLDEVALRVPKRLIAFKNGNTIINVENSILAMESSPIVLLSKLPTVQLSPDQQDLSVLGKGRPLLYIGNQQISMEELRGMPIDDIKSIEIIKNPSAKYEAHGRAVLLITRKKSSGKGVNFSLTERISKKTYVNNYLGTAFTVKNNRLEYKLDASYNHINVWESNGATYSLPNQQTHSSYLVEATTNRNQYIVGGGLYYQLDSLNSLSLSTRYRTQHEPFSIDTETNLSQASQTQQILTYSDNKGNRNFISSNLNYTREFKNSGNLFLGGQYTHFSKGSSNDILNRYQHPVYETRIQRDQAFDVDSYSLKLNLVQPIRARTGIEAGINYASTHSSSAVKLENEAITSLYKEHILGLYSSLSNDLKKLNYRLGLRFEYTEVTIESQQHSSATKGSEALFPTLNMAYTFDNETTLSFNYAKSILRPNFTTVTTTSAFINPALEFRGAIDLKPTITHEITTNFQIKNKQFTAQFFRAKAPVYYSISYDEDKQVSVMAPKNFDLKYGFSLGVDTPFSHGIWSTNTSLFLNYNLIHDERALVEKAKPFLYLSSQHQFKLNPTAAFNLNFWGQTAREEGVFRGNEQWVCDASFSTTLFKRIELSVHYNDIFSNLRYRDHYQFKTVNATSIFYTDVNEISIGLKYKFNSIKKSDYKNEDVDQHLNRVR